MKNKSYNVAVLGAGNIGSAVISRLLHLDKELLDINLSKVLVKDATKVRDFDNKFCLLYTSPSPRDATLSRMPSSA